MSISESQLVELLQETEEKGMDYLYNRYSSALYGIILRIIGEEEISREVLQDVFLRIIDRIEAYDPKKGRLFTWMLVIARNLAIDKTRSKEMSQARQSDIIGDNVYKLDSQTTEMKINDIGVRELLNELDPDQYQVVEWVYFKGFSQAETAKELNLPLGTVKTRIRASLKLLRKLVQEN